MQQELESTAKSTKKRKVNYLNNKDFLAEVIKSKEQSRMTDKLARMLQLLTARYAKKSNFANYTYNDDMQGYAMLMLVRTWHSFDPKKSLNPFAFFTQCIKNSFIQYLNQERRQRDIRDIALINQGMSPSFTFQLEKEDSSNQSDSSTDNNSEPTHHSADMSLFEKKPITSELEVFPEIPETEEESEELLKY